MIQKYKLGDRLAVAKGFFITHYGIYSGNGMVIDNSDSVGEVRERPLRDFSGGKEVRVVQTKSSFTPQEIVARARAQIGKVYRVLSQNCEQFVNEIQLGRPYSTQVLIGVTVTALIAYKLLSTK